MLTKSFNFLLPAKVKNLTNSLDILEEVSKNCMMPLTWGGRIRKLEDINLRMKKGADKVSINTIAFEDKSFIKLANLALILNFLSSASPSWM